MSTADQPDVPEPPPEEWVECTECGGVGSFPEKPGEPGCEPCRGRGAIRATVGPGRRKVQYVTDEEGHTHVVEAEPPDVPDPTDEHSTPPVIEPVVSGPGDQCPVCLGRDRRCSICRGRGVLPGSTASTQREEVRAWIRLTADLATLRGELEETRRERDGLQRAADLRGDILGKINDAIGVGRHSPWANLPAGVDFVCKQAIAERAARKEAERQRDEAIAECEDLRVMREDAVTEAEREQASRIEAWRKAEAHKAEVVRLREALEHIRVCTSPGLVMYGGTSIVVYVTGVLKTATLAAPTQTTDGE